MGTSGQKIRRFYYTRYRNSKQQIFASQYENIQLKFISQQGFPFTFSQPLLTKTGPEIYPRFGQTSWPVLPVPGRSVSIVWEQDGSPLHGQAGRPEGQSPFGSGFPIGASSIPVGIGYPKGNSVALGRGIQRGQSSTWHTILLAKYSVLYLLRPLTLERGCPTPDRPFSVAAEQADFVGCKIHKMKDFP